MSMAHALSNSLSPMQSPSFESPSQLQITGSCGKKYTRESQQCVPPSLHLKSPQTKISIILLQMKASDKVNLCHTTTIHTYTSATTRCRKMKRICIKKNKNNPFPLHSTHCHSPPPKNVDQSSCPYYLTNFGNNQMSKDEEDLH